MATYKFPQFSIEIANPIITVDANSIIVHALRTEISLSVTLETANAKLYGVELENIPVDNLNYEGEANLLEYAMNGLKKYEI
tara:strand:+ start:215 stop:460 length:246 start_codon:yes stop_codon:yes gene_type:complete